MATLLLADESVTIQRVIELTFAGEEVRVIAVGDGESAIARFDEDRPDIVLADVSIAGVDGYEFAAHVKRAAGQVPVLLLAGAFEPVDEDRARATGCDGVVVKPFEPRELAKTVRELLDGARPAYLWPSDGPRPAGRPALDLSATEAGPGTESVAETVAAVATESVPGTESAPETLPVFVTELAVMEPVSVTEPVPVTDSLSVTEPLSEAAVPQPVPELVEAPAFVSEPVDVPVSVEPEAGPAFEAVPAAASPARAASPAQASLSSVFSALLAAERQSPAALKSMAASPALSEAAVEEIVQKVLRKMTNDHVRKIVLETAERLIREEIARIKL